MTVDSLVLDQQIFDLGFPVWADVSRRRSVADLYRSRRARSGVYILGFADGERYVGLTTDVVRRFAQHQKNHADITTLTFRRVASTRQAETERRVIHTLEAGGVPLRNKAEMSVIEGDRDLDELVSPAAQSRWLQEGLQELDMSGRMEDADLRRRYRGQLGRLLAEPAGGAAVRVLARYVPLALPRPTSTELIFWSLSCLPSGSWAKMLARMNLNMQEVLGLIQEDDSVVAAFQLAESPFAEAYGPRWKAKVEARGFQVEEFRYKPGGYDQFRLYAEGERDILRLLDLEAAQKAIRTLNLNLLRKGPSYWSRNHCFELADAVFAAAD